MKKILSIVLVLAMVMGLCVMASAAEEESIVLTAENLVGPKQTAYGNATKSVNGVDFSFVELGNYGDGIQMRKKSTLCNATALPGNITKIVLEFNANKKVYSNSDWFKFSFGSSADNMTESVMFGTVKDQFTYTVTPPAGDFTFFKMEKVKSDYSFYWTSITIYYSASNHEHVESDPVYKSEGHYQHSKTTTCSAEECTWTDSTNVVMENHTIENGKCTLCDYKVPAKLNPHTVVTAPVAGTAYNLWMYQEHVELNDLLYLDGELDSQGFYLNSTDDHTKAVVIYVDVVEGGYHVYKMDGEKKVYMNIYLTDTDYVNCKWGDTPTLFTWDSEYNTFVTAAAVKGDVKYFAGTRNDRTYTTASACDVKYIDTNFKLHLSTVADVEAYYAKPQVPENGDFSAVVVALLAVSAMGITVLAKKKEF